MSLPPYFPQFIRQRVDMFAFGGPVSAYDALVMASNLQWMIDQIPQHRINWVATAFAPGEFGYDAVLISTAGGDARSCMWTHEFQHTWIRGDYPTGLDVCVAALVGSTGGDDLSLRVRIVPAATLVGDLGVAALFDETATSSGADTEAVVEGQVFFDTPLDQDKYFLFHSIEEDGEVRAPRQGLLRIEITMDVPEDDAGALTEVLVREFACQS